MRKAAGCHDLIRWIVDLAPVKEAWVTSWKAYCAERPTKSPGCFHGSFVGRYIGGGGGLDEVNLIGGARGRIVGTSTTAFCGQRSAIANDLAQDSLRLRTDSAWELRSGHIRSCCCSQVLVRARYACDVGKEWSPSHLGVSWSKIKISAFGLKISAFSFVDGAKLRALPAVIRSPA